MPTKEQIQLKPAVAFVILVVIAAVPIVEATGEHVSSHSPHVTHNFWLGPLYSQVYSFECAMDDTLEGSFSVTIDGDHFIYDQKKYDLWVGWGDGVDLYVFDNQSYEDWSQGLNATPMFSKKDLTEYSWRINIPYAGVWYVVYDNDSSIYGKQVEGTITHLSQNSAAIIGLLVIGGCTIALVIGISLYKKR